MSNNPVRGASFLLRGVSLITLPGVRGYVVVPLLINIVLFSAFTWYSAGQFEVLLDWMLPNWLDWLRWLLWPVFALTALMVVFFFFSLVANVIAAPFNGLLAEAVELHLTGRAAESEMGVQYIISELTRTVKSELTKLCYALIGGALLLLLFVIPVVNLLAPVAWMAFGAWMLSLNYLDFPMANHALSFREQRALHRERRLTSVGFGGAVMLALMIPIVNFIVIPCAVAGATALWVDEFRDVAPTRT